VMRVHEHPPSISARLTLELEMVGVTRSGHSPRDGSNHGSSSSLKVMATSAHGLLLLRDGELPARIEW
jgi:hypothetical protein